MELGRKSTRLEIRTVGHGFYQGFNLVVALAAKVSVGLLVISLVLTPEASSQAIGWLKDATLAHFAGWYIYLVAGFAVLFLVLVALPMSGRIVLGPDDAIPDHSKPAWLTMMFCAGIGVGTLAFSVSEPISHFSANPDILNGTVVAASSQAASSSMRFVFLHWGLSAWGCFATVGLTLGLACHRLGQPMTMRSAVAPLFGKCLEGPLGHAIDIISVLAIIAGITTTIVLGLEQVCTGLSVLTGSRFFADGTGAPPLTALLMALVVAISITVTSIISGVDRGVKWVSQLGIFLAFSLLLVFVVFGAGSRFFGTLADGTEQYLTNLPRLLVTLYDPETASAARAWQGSWSIFYWAWLIALSPFVGMFLAQISRGRTIREFILGAMLGPTAMCFIWFSGIGGSALLLELDGTAGGRIMSAEHAFRIYTAIDIMLTSGFALAVKALVTILFLVLVVASSTAAILAIKSIGAAGSKLAETPGHSMIWAVAIAANVGAIMVVGGVSSIRDVMVVGAVPFSLIMVLMVPSVIWMIVGTHRSAKYSELDGTPEPQP